MRANRLQVCRATKHQDVGGGNAEVAIRSRDAV
jgi:hypothetical protein